MKPIDFKQANREFAKDQPQYNNFPALEIDGHVIGCWKANIFERIQILFTGKIWVDLMTFGKPLTPSYVSAYRRNLFYIKGDFKFWAKLNKFLTKK